ncbi:MAG: helix-turn-helix domain-containing protein [Peptococcus niger]
MNALKDKFCVSVKKAADAMDTNPRQVYRLIERGQLETVKVGSIKVLVRSIERFIEGDMESGY